MRRFSLGKPAHYFCSIPLTILSDDIIMISYQYKEATQMFIVNTNDIPGQPIQALGVVTGSTIQSKNIGKDIGQGFKTLVGGELKSYTKMMDEARNIAMQRMVEQAQQMGADAIVSLRFASSAVMAGAAEVLAYGTAVKYINN